MQDHKMVQKGNNIGNNSRSSYDKKLLKKRYENIAMKKKPMNSSQEAKLVKLPPTVMASLCTA